MKSIKQESDKFCKFCGSKMLVEKIPAGEIVKASFYGTFRPYNNFDVDTGKPNYGLHFKCPNSRWYNSHSEWKELLKKTD